MSSVKISRGRVLPALPRVCGYRGGGPRGGGGQRLGAFDRGVLDLPGHHRRAFDPALQADSHEM